MILNGKQSIVMLKVLQEKSRTNVNNINFSNLEKFVQKSINLILNGIISNIWKHVSCFRLD